MGSADPFGNDKSTIVDSLKWLRYKINQGQAKRAAKDGGSVSNVHRSASRKPDAHIGQTVANQKLSILRTNTIVQIIIAGIVAAIPLTFYLAQTDSLEKAVVSVGDDVMGRGASNTAPRQNLMNSSAAQRPTEVLGAIGSGAPSETLAAVMDDTALEHAAKHAQQNYVCPMHPDVISSDPNATCPICGMDLVPLEAGGEGGIVKLTPTVMNSLGVRTAKAKRRTLYRRIDSVGYINVDENNLRTISLRSEGWVERLVVKTTGERVNKGQLLMELYAPILVNAQEEFLQAMRHNNELLIKASRDRLLALGVAEEQIATLEETKAVEPLVKVYAPQSGIVSELIVREGMFVKPSQNLLNLVDLSSVWLMVDIFERQADWVQTGQRAEATLPFMPGKSWEGKVEYVYPSLDASTRSLKVRLRFDNFEEELKPNMYADVTIYAKPKRDVLTIPREALIRTGNEKRVVVALGEGKFIPMPVSTGMETDDRVEVLSGLADGDEVVTSSQFLIDSESSLKAALARMAGG
jgi:Cu(I)/Ag(I) efflux system membrane fusion protein